MEVAEVCIVSTQNSIRWAPKQALDEVDQPMDLWARAFCPSVWQPLGWRLAARYRAGAGRAARTVE